MPEPTTVWAVDLIREPKKDRQGTLTLDEGQLVFEPRSSTSSALRIPLDAIRRVRRLRGSPVMVVVHRRSEITLETAFYFVQPPPLEPVTGASDRPTVLSFGRGSKRRARRQNVGYLGMGNRQKRVEIDEWVRAVDEARGRSG
ncbi:MAG: hypothetical protein ACXVQU_03430 [Actinomycetota bacterium]